MHRCSLAASNFVFSALVCTASRCDPLDVFDHSSGRMFPGLVETCFFVILPWTHIHPSRGFLLRSAIRVTPIHGSGSDVSPSMFQQSSMVAFGSRSRLDFLLSPNTNMIQRYRKIVLQNIEFRPSSNVIPIHVISNNGSEIVSSFDIWIWISDISFFLWSLFLKFLLEVALRLGHSGG